MRTAAHEHKSLSTHPENECVHGNFVLLALFDGVRGCSMALRSQGVEPIVDYSSEVDKSCMRLIAAKFPGCHQVGDVRKIDKAALQRMVVENGVDRPWLIVGGSPCQDLSGRRGANRKGLVGKKSKLFYEFVRIASTLMSLGVKVAFLLENVASMADSERDEMSACLGVEPIEIDSVVVSACHRKRYYWTNLPIAPIKPCIVDVNSFLDEGWERVPVGKPFRCFVASTVRQAKLGREPLGVRRISDGEERVPNADEREAILGFPRGHTRLHNEHGEDLLPEALRLKMLGNSFSVQTIAHLLAPIIGCAKNDEPLLTRPLRQGAWILTMDRICDAVNAQDTEQNNDYLSDED